MPTLPVERHNTEISANRSYFKQKPILNRIFQDLHEMLATHLKTDITGPTVEIGSGLGLIKRVLPQCLTTDLFANPGIDRVENVYALSLGDETVANVIMFHIFHHLRYPGTGLAELRRVLRPGGRVILFEHCHSSILGRIVNALHHEPTRAKAPLQWIAPSEASLEAGGYYAALGNATRIFEQGAFADTLSGWHPPKVYRLSCLSYILSGGFSKPQLFPERFLPYLKKLEPLCDRFPDLFASALLVTLDKKGA